MPTLIPDNSRDPNLPNATVKSGLACEDSYLPPYRCPDTDIYQEEMDRFVCGIPVQICDGEVNIGDIDFDFDFEASSVTDTPYCTPAGNRIFLCKTTDINTGVPTWNFYEAVDGSSELVLYTGPREICDVPTKEGFCFETC